MEGIQRELRTVVKKLFQEKKIDLLIGYARGSLPLTSTPVFIRENKDVDKLIFDITCGNNLAKYLKKSPAIDMKGAKVAIVGKGCDGRAIIQLVAEGQVSRDNLLIIGVPCDGVVDFRKLREKSDGEEISRCRFEGEEIIVEGKDFKSSFNKSDLLSDSCKRCRYPNPPLYDIFITEPKEPADMKDEYEDVNRFEELSSRERWRYFEDEISRCIRCYACRNVCPMCYCEECFVDQTNPQWFGKSTDLSDSMIFHIVRVLHTAGRCVDCGACERACPMNVNLGLLGKRVEKEVRERFDYVPGLHPDETPAMAAYNEEDKQEFIL